MAMRSTAKTITLAGWRHFVRSRPRSLDAGGVARHGLAISRLPVAWRTVCEWRRRARGRAQLRALSPREIADFCPKVSEADHEARKRFWQQ